MYLDIYNGYIYIYISLPLRRRVVFMDTIYFFVKSNLDFADTHSLTYSELLFIQTFSKFKTQEGFETVIFIL